MNVKQAEWALQFEQQIKAAIAVNNKVQVQAAQEFLKRVEKRTPIGDPSLWKYPAPAGYKPGTLRASWTMELSSKKEIVVATIANNQPYAERVEFGWSTQAPNGMLRVTVKEWPRIVDEMGRKNKI